MGMKTYPVKDYGLYVTEEDLCGYAERNNTETFELLMELGNYYSGGDCECISLIHGASFDGGEDFAILPLKNSPSLFSQAYTSKDEALEELKSNFGEYLPDDFDYEGRFVECDGTVWG